MLTVQTDSSALEDFDLSHPLLVLDTLDQSFLSEVFMPTHRIKTSLSDSASKVNFLTSPEVQRSLCGREDD